MKLCRFNDNRIGRVEGGQIVDITALLDRLSPVRWPYPPGDALIASLDRIRPLAETADGPRHDIGDVRLLSPIANPSAIFGAALNYRDHLDEANADFALNFGKQIEAIEKLGLFLKANSALAGPGEGIRLGFDDRRVDHEVELVAIIGKGGRNIGREQALGHVAGYCIGLDISVRGTQERSFRKSSDTYAMLGPCFVTADEIADPNTLDFWLDINGERRQSSNTRYLIYDVQKLVELASSVCTLHPGDIIYTGTPAGVGELKAGDEVVAEVAGLGTLRTTVSR